MKKAKELTTEEKLLRERVRAIYHDHLNGDPPLKEEIDFGVACFEAGKAESSISKGFRMSDQVENQSDNPIHVVAHGLAAAFAENPEKITYWLFTKNLNFGNSKPADLILSGLGGKVAHFVLAAQEMGAPALRREGEK